ncbi:hypothetical protein [Dactylosporangium darangshiense]|uniref:hypothetical protein n=1 Tax=Dactylosporangium darangshiense TaxID=579108 RepID=UPI0031E94AF3
MQDLRVVRGERRLHLLRRRLRRPVSPRLQRLRLGYFPDGPSDDLGNGAWEGPQFQAIDAPWYSWTASW